MYCEQDSLLVIYLILENCISHLPKENILLPIRSYMNACTKTHESLILNIQNIMMAKQFDTKTKKVFIFENPSILSEIIAFQMDVSVVILGGFVNLSVYLLLDQLIANHNELYYNGDFDPEGLLIAQKLKEKYPSLKFFCYKTFDYECCISKEKVSDTRIKKLY